ncbi:hypothetical protein QPK87_15575 [Kamptonema cortianum]|nr:hypothetical protein [Oscillatoria laete-virens]MDK3157983.1 hypothetical protein [Kamptonema cortianum]MDL5053138.1 hypothetical protein [Oscillatoria laete-virens NRMC-F 0139]
MKTTDQKLAALFAAAKRAEQFAPQEPSAAPYGFATRMVARHFAGKEPSKNLWEWEAWVFRGAFGVLILCGVLLWSMRGALEVYSDEYIEARVIETSVYEEII